MQKKTILFFLKFAFTSGLLGFLLYRTNLLQVFNSIQTLSIGIVPLILLLYFFAIAVNTFKWSLLLPQYSLIYLLKYNLISIYFSTILPSQITGDVAKSYILGKNGSDPHRIIASVFIDKITGLIAIIFISLFGIIFTTKTVPVLVLLSLIAFLGIVISILIGIRFKLIYNIIQNIFNKISRLFPKSDRLLNHINTFIEEWKIFLVKINILAFNILIGIIFHFIAVLINFIIAKQLGIVVSYYDWCWIYGLLSIVLLLPFSIAGIGLRDGTLISVLGLFGIISEKAIALSFILLGFILFFSLIGFILNFTMNKKRTF